MTKHHRICRIFPVLEPRVQRNKVCNKGFVEYFEYESPWRTRNPLTLGLQSHLKKKNRQKLSPIRKGSSKYLFVYKVSFPVSNPDAPCSYHVRIWPRCKYLSSTPLPLKNESKENIISGSISSTAAFYFYSSRWWSITSFIEGLLVLDPLEEFSTLHTAKVNKFEQLLSRPLHWLCTHCLKITKKVAFNIANEASYIYILSGQKLIKNAKISPLVFLKLEACGQTVLPDWPILIRQKLLENAQSQIFKYVI